MCKFLKKNKCEGRCNYVHNTNNTRSESDNQIDTLEIKVKDLKDTLQTKEYIDVHGSVANWSSGQ